jgi:hypothetical protein
MVVHTHVVFKKCQSQLDTMQVKYKILLNVRASHQLGYEARTQGNIIEVDITLNVSTLYVSTRCKDHKYE